MSQLEDTFAFQLYAAGIPSGPENRQVLVYPKRRFRWDFAWPEVMVAVEVEGGIWKGYQAGGQGTGHSHPLGIERDITKHNLGVIAGWRCLRVTGKQIESGEALAMVQRLVKSPGKEPV